ncbi:hypothetical protein V1477_021077 [Vespula maculifrons]|uniref:Uncharacterized protein n=1 Tax=Vespula maculifrons TaxID=7453 RepID=A0ABD2AJS8_VESMC
MTYYRHSIVHLSCVVIKDKSGYTILSDYIDSDIMLYVIGRIQKKGIFNIHHQEYRDLDQLICWFARILLATIDPRSLNSTVYLN